MKKMIIRILLLMLPALFLNAGSVLLPDSLVLQTVYAQDWKNEFVDICGKTDNAMSLSKEELKQLIERCDRLRLTVENQEETEKRYTSNAFASAGNSSPTSLNQKKKTLRPEVKPKPAGCRKEEVRF